MNINIEEIISLAKIAGNEIMEIYKQDFDIEYKDDNSPLTIADKKSNTVIMEWLKKLTPNIPILSEEEKAISYDERKKWNMFWCVDPLDWTKEFIKKNGEFTVNIALIKNNKPILWVIYSPVLWDIYRAEEEKWAYKENKIWAKIKLSQRKKKKTDTIKIVASRSHRWEAMDEYILKLEDKYDNIEYVSAGSSLKFCLLAEWKADIYPRFVPTMEWDTAAGDIILRETGGEIIDLESEDQLLYNKENLRNNYFIAE